MPQMSQPQRRDRKARALAMIESGVSDAEAARLLDLKPRTIAQWRHAAGIFLRRGKAPTDPMEQPNVQE